MVVVVHGRPVVSCTNANALHPVQRATAAHSFTVHLTAGTPDPGHTHHHPSFPLHSASDRPTLQQRKHVRTGSVVVERTASPRAPSAGAVTAWGGAGSGETGGEYGDYYAEEQRFWRERCPPAETAAAADRREKGTSATAVTVQRQTPPANSSPRTAQAAVGKAANYDYFSAEAAYRSSPRDRAAADFLYSSSENDGFVRGGRGHSSSSHRRTSLDREEGGDGLDDEDNPPPTPDRHPPKPARRQGARDGRGVQNAERLRKQNAERRRSRARSRSLQESTAILHGVLESVEGGLTTIEVHSSDGIVP